MRVGFLKFSIEIGKSRRSMRVRFLDFIREMSRSHPSMRVGFRIVRVEMACAIGICANLVLAHLMSY